MYIFKLVPCSDLNEGGSGVTRTPPPTLKNKVFLNLDSKLYMFFFSLCLPNI